MDESALALWLARGRLGIGAVALAAPGLATRGMTGRKARGAEPVFARMLGARDLALGLGTIIAIDHGTPVRGWLEGAALADAVDAIACTLGRDQLTANAFRGTVAAAGLAAVGGWLLSKRLDPAPQPHPGQPEAIVTGHHEPADPGQPPPAPTDV